MPHLLLWPGGGRGGRAGVHPGHAVFVDTACEAGPGGGTICPPSAVVNIARGRRRIKKAVGKCEAPRLPSACCPRLTVPQPPPVAVLWGFLGSESARRAVSALSRAPVRS